MRIFVGWQWLVVVLLAGLAQAAFVRAAIADEPIKDDLAKAGQAVPFDLEAAKRAAT
jgi:hypothetical protein